MASKFADYSFGRVQDPYEGLRKSLSGVEKRFDTRMARERQEELDRQALINQMKANRRAQEKLDIEKAQEQRAADKRKREIEEYQRKKDLRDYMKTYDPSEQFEGKLTKARGIYHDKVIDEQTAMSDTYDALWDALSPEERQTGVLTKGNQANMNKLLTKMEERANIMGQAYDDMPLLRKEVQGQVYQDVLSAGGTYPEALEAATLFGQQYSSEADLEKALKATTDTVNKAAKAKYDQNKYLFDKQLLIAKELNKKLDNYKGKGEGQKTWLDVAEAIERMDLVSFGIIGNEDDDEEAKRLAKEMITGGMSPKMALKVIKNNFQEGLDRSVNAAGVAEDFEAWKTKGKKFGDDAVDLAAMLEANKEALTYTPGIAPTFEQSVASSMDKTLADNKFKAPGSLFQPTQKVINQTSVLGNTPADTAIKESISAQDRKLGFTGSTGVVNKDSENTIDTPPVVNKKGAATEQVVGVIPADILNPTSAQTNLLNTDTTSSLNMEPFTETDASVEVWDALDKDPDKMPTKQIIKELEDKYKRADGVVLYPSHIKATLDFYNSKLEQETGGLKGAISHVKVLGTGAITGTAELANWVANMGESMVDHESVTNLGEKNKFAEFLKWSKGKEEEAIQEALRYSPFGEEILRGAQTTAEYLGLPLATTTKTGGKVLWEGSKLGGKTLLGAGKFIRHPIKTTKAGVRAVDSVLPKKVVPKKSLDELLKEGYADIAKKDLTLSLTKKAQNIAKYKDELAKVKKLIEKNPNDKILKQELERITNILGRLTGK